MPELALSPRRPPLWRRLGWKLVIVGELLAAFASGGRWWLVPFALVMIAASLLLGVVQVVEYVAPFVYTLF